MNDLMIVWPPAQSAATRIHLYSEGYRPGPKKRSFSGSLCGVVVSTSWRQWSAGHWHDVPTGRWHQPFSEGFEFVQPPWQWCAICLGRALDQAGLANDAAGLVWAQVNR